MTFWWLLQKFLEILLGYNLCFQVDFLNYFQSFYHQSLVGFELKLRFIWFWNVEKTYRKQTAQTDTRNLIFFLKLFMLILSIISLIIDAVLLALWDKSVSGWFDIADEGCPHFQQNCDDAGHVANTFNREMENIINGLLIYFLVISVLSIVVGVSNPGVFLII